MIIHPHTHTHACTCIHTCTHTHTHTYTEPRLFPLTLVAVVWNRFHCWIRRGWAELQANRKKKKEEQERSSSFCISAYFTTPHHLKPATKETCTSHLIKLLDVFIKITQSFLRGYSIDNHEGQRSTFSHREELKHKNFRGHWKKKSLPLIQNEFSYFSFAMDLVRTLPFWSLPESNCPT